MITAESPAKSALRLLADASPPLPRVACAMQIVILADDAHFRLPAPCHYRATACCRRRAMPAAIIGRFAADDGMMACDAFFSASASHFFGAPSL